MIKKSVLIVINSLSQGGAERVVSILLERFYHDSTFDVELVLLEDEIAYKIPKGVKITKLSQLNNHDSSLKKTLSIPFLAYRLYGYIQKREPDLIVSFLFRADFVNVLASYLHQKPVIVSQRVNASSTYNNTTLNAKINKFLIKTLYPKASMVINVSAGTKNDLEENFGIESQKQIVIYNPYNHQKIQQLSKEPIDYVLEKEKTIVAVSRFRPIKNIEMILEAFAKIKNDAKLVLVGDGTQEEVLKNLVKKLKIEKKVIFTGGEDNPYKYCAKSSIYVSASRSEGFPNALVEAMICACAVISTDCPSGPREILSPSSDVKKRVKEGSEYGEFGILVAIDDIASLANVFDTLLEDDVLRDSYRQKALERANDFALEDIYKQYADAFSSLIEEGQS